MATSFAAYASQYLNRQQNAAASSVSTSQPMFFSFTTDDGSRHGGHDTDLDDMDDPHLRESGATEQEEEEDEDPYLRLDEQEHVGREGLFGHGHQSQSIPLMARSAEDPESPPGWLAHLAHSPTRRRSPSPAPSSSSAVSSDSSPPADLLVASPKAPQGQAHAHAPLAPPRTAHSLSLTESLLPRDGFNRPLDVFSLPDPRHTPRKRRKHHDAPFISLWLALVSLCLFFSLLLLFTTQRPKEVPSVMLPYTVLLRTVPMLVILTCLSAAAAYVHVYLLRVFVKPVMVATSVFVPATLFVSAIWAFVGSFMWDGDTVPTWGETVGLRLFAVVPLVLSLITARRLLHLPRQIHTTSSTLTLSTHLLINNPFLLALSPAILLIMFVGSIPFVTLIFRLLLVGYSTKIGQTNAFEWHVRAWANWAIVGVAIVWFWSWAVARGVLRVTVAGVIGAWYFADPSAPLPPPTSTHTIHSALIRSSGPSLGTIILAALLLTLLRLLSLLALLLRRLPPLLLRIPYVPLSVPVAMYVVPGVQYAVGWLEVKSGMWSRYALVYTGLTGVGFWEGAVRGGELVRGVEGPGGVVEEEEEGQGRKAGRKGRKRQPVLQKRRFGSEPPLALLTISPLTLSFPFALMTYLFVAHTIGAPNEALGAAVLAGGVTSLVGLFCVGVVRDTADTLYLCYCIDKAAGEKRREEVFIAFEYDSSSSSTPIPIPRARHAGRPGAFGTQPEVIVPRAAGGTSAGGPRRGGRETLFDAVAEESSDDGGDGDGQGRQPRSSRGVPVQRGQRTAPLDPYLEDVSGTPTQASIVGLKSKGKGRQAQPRPPHEDVDEEEEEEDLDPFRRSVVDDEEAQVGRAVRTPSARPTFAHVALAGGQSRRVSGGGAGGIGGGAGGGGIGGGQRMMTSTQELNMKSQFLMNMRPYGVEESQASGAGGMGGSGLGGSGLVASGLGGGGSGGGADGNESLSEGEEGLLGPGSDFFK